LKAGNLGLPDPPALGLNHVEVGATLEPSMRENPSLSITLPHGRRRPLSTPPKTSGTIIVGRSRFDLLIALVVSLFICVAQPARPAAACVLYQDQFSANSYLADLFIYPTITCSWPFNSAARIIGGGNTNPYCGTWAWTQGAPGFQYMAGNLPCLDGLVVEIQMPDQGVWYYYYTIVVYPHDDPFPQP
jgi:hypothetical protein